MENVARPWMLAYTIVFGLLSVHFVFNDTENQYNLFYVIEGICIFLLIFVGNLIYSLDVIIPKIRKIWKFVFPIVVLDFIISGVVDSIYGRHTQSASVEVQSIAWILGFVTFFPTFLAHYKIGYGKETTDVDT